MAPIGVILLIGLAAVLTAGTAAYLMTRQEPRQPRAAGFLVDDDPDRLRVRMTSGDPLPAAATDLVLESTDHQDRIPLTGFTEELGPSWNTGESICLVGDGPVCSYLDSEDALEGFRITSGDQTLYAWEGTPASADDAGATGPILLSSGSGGDGSGASGGSSSPDLTATILGTSPDDPVAGDATTFDVRVENTGDAATGSDTRLAVGVNGSVLSTHTVADLPAGANTTVTSDPWTAEGGSHSIVATSDDGRALSEADEENNEGYFALVVGVEDPGHAYEDVDNDRLFTPGTDLKIPDPDIHDGIYHIQESWSLVVPESVGSINASRVDLTAGSQGHVIVDVDVTTADELVHVGAGTYVEATEVTLTSPDERIRLEADAGSVRVNGSTLDSSAERVILRSGTSIHAADTTLLSGDERTIVDADGSVDLTDATLDADEKIPITAGSDVVLEGARLGAAEEITIDAVGSATVAVDGVAVADEDDTVVVSPEDATIQGSPSSGSVQHGG